MKTFIVLIAALMSLTSQAQVMNPKIQTDSVQLDQSEFSFVNPIVNFNVTQNKSELRIYNNICPQIPGRINCKAMPMLAFSGEFELSAPKIDGCGVKIYYSNKINIDGSQASIRIKDYRSMFCDVVYVSDLEVTLKIASKEEVSRSYLYFTILN